MIMLSDVHFEPIPLVKKNYILQKIIFVRNKS